jgi:6-phosphogluconolactonase (cycloisomerase 2 family)
MLRIAAIATVFFPLSHADVILSRWNIPYETDSQWGWKPGGESKIVTLHVEQYPQNAANGKNDISAAYVAKHQVRMATSIADALLSHDGKTLAVDGVLLIGEHGDYPMNERGQKLYPRKELFDQIVQVFRAAGKCVPVFCDKHLSWNPEWAQAMVTTARAMKFPLFGGSTTPYCGTDPHVSVTSKDRVTDALAIYYGGEEVYGFHSLELMQSLIQYRKGGERGVKSITAWRGESVEKGLPASLRPLLDAALRASKDVKMTSSSPWLGGEPENYVLYMFEHYDGLKSYHLMMTGCVTDWTVAIRVEGDDKIRVGRATMGDADSFYGHFARLNSLLQKMFMTGQSPVTEDRVLLTTQMIARATEALQQPETPLVVNLESEIPVENLQPMSIYIASGEKGVHRAVFNPATGVIAPSQQIVDRNSLFLITHPSMPILYSVDAWNDKVLAYRIQSDGGLTLISEVASAGSVPCHLAADPQGRYLMVANYNGGVSLFALNNEGEVSPVLDAVEFPGGGPHKSQERSHPHGVELSPCGQYWYVPDLGTDKIHVLSVDLPNGKLIQHPEQACEVKPGSGPRHIAFSPDGRIAVVVNELSNTVTLFDREKSGVPMQLKEDYNLLPDGWAKPSWAAEVHFHPSGKSCYASNRGENSVVCFPVDEKDRKLEQAHWAAGGSEPQHHLVDPLGRWLLVSYRASHEVRVFPLHPETGAIVGNDVSVLPIQNPVCIVFHQEQ